MDPLTEPDQVLTLALFDSLATSLRVRWPDWFREFLTELLKELPSDRQTWLPGGWLYATPRLIVRDTAAYVSGQLQLMKWTDGQSTVVPWPSGYVVVGHCGDGGIVIDTTSQVPEFLNVYIEDYELRPFLRLSELRLTPKEFAHSLIESERRAEREREERRRSQVNPIFRRE